MLQPGVASRRVAVLLIGLSSLVATAAWGVGGEPVPAGVPTSSPAPVAAPAPIEASPEPPGPEASPPAAQSPAEPAVLEVVSVKRSISYESTPFTYRWRVRVHNRGTAPVAGGSLCLQTTTSAGKGDRDGGVHTLLVPRLAAGARCTIDTPRMPYPSQGEATVRVWVAPNGEAASQVTQRPADFKGRFSF